VIGHPGHELQVFRFSEIIKPIVAVLTDGSGFSGSSRLYQTQEILSEMGSTESSIMGRFTDKTLYQIIFQKDLSQLFHLLDELVEILITHEIEVVMGDAIEGFNPTHDLCRYIINNAVRIAEKALNCNIANFDFPLDAPPASMDNPPNSDTRSIHLNEEDWNRKYQAAMNYKELAWDIQNAIGNYGTEIFRTEFLRPVSHPEKLKAWSGVQPQYELYGRARVASGKYRDIISFSRHMKPIGEALWKYTTEVIGQA